MLPIVSVVRQKSTFSSACRPSGSDGINIEAQILTFGAFLHAGIFSRAKKFRARSTGSNPKADACVRSNVEALATSAATFLVAGLSMKLARPTVAALKLTPEKFAGLEPAPYSYWPGARKPRQMGTIRMFTIG
ncbi:hypothetical protein [Bradyrhizobium murdochi]|uniref:hypothetical protein n=1 Tax=Bradyrhizobium murdochi TaxID=1038859 RepID=UPI0012EB53FA|nr:hypothetical protein [Bradyrhizobium murdochi]